MGEAASESRVARLARLAGIQAQIGYKKKSGPYGGKPSVVVDNSLARQFAIDAPDRAWVTDITYLRTHEGFASLCVVIDLFSRRVASWAVQSRQTSELAVRASLMAIWRRKPGPGLLIHSDQGAQYTSREWAVFLREHNLEHSMSRCGNCHDDGQSFRSSTIEREWHIAAHTIPASAKTPCNLRLNFEPFAWATHLSVYCWKACFTSLASKIQQFQSKRRPPIQCCSAYWYLISQMSVKI